MVYTPSPGRAMEAHAGAPERESRKRRFSPPLRWSSPVTYWGPRRIWRSPPLVGDLIPLSPLGVPSSFEGRNVGDPTPRLPLPLSGSLLPQRRIRCNFSCARCEPSLSAWVNWRRVQGRGLSLTLCLLIAGLKEGICQKTTSTAVVLRSR